jgi:uncharacterized membrane protein
VIEKIGTAIDAAGVVIMVTGAAIAFVVAAVRLSRRDSDVYRRLRHQLGQAILLGLELLVAGDIVRTVAASPSLTSVAILAAIVLIRTFLSYSLEVETTGKWPWQKRDIAAVNHLAHRSPDHLAVPGDDLTGPRDWPSRSPNRSQPQRT